MRSDTQAQRLERPMTWLLAASVLVAGVLSVATSGRAAVNTPVTTALARRPLPEALTEVESSAEDIVDFALAENRRDVVLTAVRLRASTNGAVAGALTRSGVPSAKIDQLEQRANRLARLARRGSFVDVALAANGISELMPDLYARFQNRVPALILALDYFDREAQLRSLARQPAKVALAVVGLDRAWPRVRPKVVAAGGIEEAAAYDSHLRAMKRLEPDARRGIQAEAVRGLELVDELEHVFTR
jgi:hypothetical protein